MNVNKISIIVIAVLVISAGVMLRQLANAKGEKIEQVKKVEITRSKIVAARELPAFTLIEKNHLRVRKGSDESDQPDVRKFMDRYLLISVKQGGEIKDENLAPESASPVLDNATAVTIPASTTTSLGGQLRVGDLVELFAVHSNNKKGSTNENAAIQNSSNENVKKFDRLVVLNILPANKEADVQGAITLAVPTGQRDEFVAAVGGTELLVTRKLAVHKQQQ